MKQLDEKLNELKANAWSKHVAPRILAVDGLLHQEAYQQGVQAYLKGVYDQFLDKLILGCKSRDDDQFVRGQIAMLKQIIDLPEMVHHMIEEKTKSTGPKGDAGY